MPYGDIAFKLQQRINELSKKYDTPSFEPHLTLLGSMNHGVTELIQLTNTLAGVLDPFEILLTRLGYRDTFYQSFFIHAKKSEELMKARNTAERLFDISPEQDYMPHISLMYGDFKSEEKERIISRMSREVYISFRVNSLMLVNTKGKPKEWKKVHSAEFRHHS